MHPGQWTDDQFVMCSPLARLLALGLRNESDDNGVFEWNPVKLKMRLLPADNCNIESLLVELVSTNQIIHFDIDGKKYGLIRNFLKYQKPKYPSYQYPIPEVLPEGFVLKEAHSGSPTGNPNQRERREEERRKDLRASPDALAGFKVFWLSYPRKKSKAKAEKAWTKIRPDEQLQDRILRALERAKKSVDWTKDNGKYTPYPASWLNARGWEDEDEPPRKSHFSGAI